MRAYNFGAGPATLPTALLEEVQEELLDWRGLGMSVMEIGHRTSHFQALLEETEADLRELMVIPSNYHVLFLGGAARSQFSMIPLNLLSGSKQGAYLVSGIWSALAYEEALRLKKAYCVASSADGAYLEVPEVDSLSFHENTAYLYYTPNETVNGVRFSKVPDYPHLPLIADLTSCILTEPFLVSQFGLIFAGAQKTLGIAGMTVVIIRSDLLENSSTSLPLMWDYQTQVRNHSIYATPPVFNIYIAAKMLKWMKAEGGVGMIFERQKKKAASLYSYIDGSSFYQARVLPHARSLVNVNFTVSDPSLNAEFIAKASKHQLLALQGHRTVGGLRASLYPAMPMEGVLSLIEFMEDFARGHS